MKLLGLNSRVQFDGSEGRVVAINNDHIILRGEGWSQILFLNEVTSRISNAQLVVLEV